MTDSSIKLDSGSSATSLSLLNRARRKESGAWDRLVSLYTPLVYCWCRRIGLQEADAADMGQEVFQAVARKLKDFRRDRAGDTFRGWLKVITRNKLRDFAQAKAQAKVGIRGGKLDALIHPPPDPTLDDVQNKEEIRILYRRAMELIERDFTEKTWQAFWLVSIDDRSPADAASDLGMSINSVYLAKSRILKRLREEFAELL